MAAGRAGPGTFDAVNPVLGGASRSLRALDITLGALALLPALAIGVVIALVAWFVQGRPVLFEQTRAGLHGRSFRLIKFRTMATEATGADGGPLPDAVRITPLGHFLRRSRLDEVPELLHILRGEMSIVGPRPLLPEVVAGFGELADRRGAVRPGLTGWAQIHGNTLLDGRSKVALDIWYVGHRSLLLDVYIILRTICVVILGEKIDTRRVNEAIEYAFGSGWNG
jgi:lipopolysaccharide/colanic/teichoic acid biosynthesis glycosyltransferase